MMHSGKEGRNMEIILASASPRRKELMALITGDYTVCTSDVEERGITADTPALLAEKLACAKCAAVHAAHPDAAVIGCDTVVDVDGEVYGKPRDDEDAKRMLRTLSGRSHRVHTGVCVMCGQECRSFAETTKVVFAPLGDEEIEAYVKSGDPRDKAGAYGIQSGAARFVTGIEGCYFNVMGFPVSRVYAALREMGIL